MNQPQPPFDGFPVDHASAIAGDAMDMEEFQPLVMEHESPWRPEKNTIEGNTIIPNPGNMGIEVNPLAGYHIIPTEHGPHPVSIENEVHGAYWKGGCMLLFGALIGTALAGAVAVGGSFLASWYFQVPIPWPW